MNTIYRNFEWHEPKNTRNRNQHGIDFKEAVEVFSDPNLIIRKDEKNSFLETRYFGIGLISSTGKVATVRFTLRGRIRIIGAGYWRKQREIYEKENAES